MSHCSRRSPRKALDIACATKREFTRHFRGLCFRLSPVASIGLYREPTLLANTFLSLHCGYNCFISVKSNKLGILGYKPLRKKNKQNAARGLARCSSRRLSQTVNIFRLCYSILLSSAEWKTFLLYISKGDK